MMSFQENSGHGPNLGRDPSKNAMMHLAPNAAIIP